MYFCEKCQNMLYIKISETDPNDLSHFCRNCGHEDKTIHIKDISISKYELNSNDQSHTMFINEYTKLDPTVPRIKTIPCPNQDCACNKEKGVETDILYVRNNDEKLSYVYMCCHCDTTWNSGS